MNTVTIVSEADIDLSGIERALAGHLNCHRGAGGQLVVEESNSRVYIYHPPGGSGELTMNELYLDYSWVDLVKNVVERIADNPLWTVENDFGTTLPGDKFVARLKDDPNWDWRV